MTTFVQNEIDWRIAQCLVHSLFFFDRLENPRVCEAYGGPDVSSSSTQETAQESQLGGETNGLDSPLVQAGSSSVGANSTGSVAAGAGSSGPTAGGTAIRGNIAGEQYGGNGNTEITTIDTSDPQVTQAAILGETYASLGADQVANNALNDEAGTATAAIQGNSLVATAALQAGVIDTANDDSLAIAALQSAANAEANSTTAVEASSAESQETATNALAAAQNETLAGVTPAQEFQEVSSGTTSTSGLSSGKIATWITIAVGLIGIIYFVRKGKPA